MKMIALFALFAIITPALSTLELTAYDFQEKTTGKKAMVKFYAPWCGVSISPT